jgi:cytochrome c553
MSGRIVKWVVRGALALALLVGLAVATGYAVTARAMGRRYAGAEHAARLAASAGGAADSAVVARGRHLVEVVARCGECHGESLGGQLLADDLVMGRLQATNLTSGEGGAARLYDDAALARAIRHGIAADGRPLVVMPADVYQPLDDADVAAMIAYIRSRPPVDNPKVPTRVGPVPALMYAAGLFPLLPVEHLKPADSLPRATPAPGPTAEYGAHLATVSGCRGCHGERLGGDGMHGAPGAPKAPNLSPGGRLASWSEADFVRALRTGRRPDGSALGDAMPWRSMGRMSDEELRALWLYMRSVPARADG